MSSTTHPLPHHPPSTPLPIGEAVYLISGRLDEQKVRSTYIIYNWLTPEEILKDFILCDSEAAAKRKSTGELIKISIHMLGYIEGERHYSEQHAVMQSPILLGYDIRWEYRDSSGYHSIFEDESGIVPLRDLVILNGVELLAEVNMDGGSTKGQQK